MLAPEQGCHEAYIRIGNCTVRGLEETFRIATFADGQPFGVKIKEVAYEYKRHQVQG